MRRCDAIVLGGGMAGLAAADALSSSGARVSLVEGALAVGGLARSIVVGEEPIEPYYHHVFPQDSATRALIDRLMLAADLEWLQAPMAIMHRGRVWPFDAASDLLRFGALSRPARIRLGAATVMQVVRRDRARLDRHTVAVEGPRWFGSEAFDVVWRPLLAAKFGAHADEVAMAWLRARIAQRWTARGSSGDRLGYLRGGIGRLAESYAANLQASGVEFHLGRRATKLTRVAGRWRLALEGGGRPAVESPIVIAALAGGVLQRLVELPTPYRRSLEAIPYRGIVCALVVLRQPVSRYYWTNVTDRLGLGCVGIIEHTNLVDRGRYGGRSLLYLAHYSDPADPAWAASPEELVNGVEGALRVLNPRFQRDWVVDVMVARDRFAQPVPVAGGPMPRLGVRTGLPGLYHVSLAHVYPDDRGVSKALEAGGRVAAVAIADEARCQGL